MYSSEWITTTKVMLKHTSYIGSDTVFIHLCNDQKSNLSVKIKATSRNSNVPLMMVLPRVKARPDRDTDHSVDFLSGIS